MSTWDPGKTVRRGLIGRCIQNHHWGRQEGQLGRVEEEASTGDSSRGLSDTSEVSTAALPLEVIYTWLFH